MRYVLILFFILCVYSCRSSKHTHSSYSGQSHTEETVTVSRKDSTATEQKDHFITIEGNNALEYSRITTYSDSGRISQLQEQWRRIGSGKLSVGSGRSSAVSVTESSDSASRSDNNDVKEEIATKQESDSRPVQGWKEWIALSLAALLFLTGMIKLTKK